MHSVSVVAPAYNEGENIPLFVEKVARVFSKNKIKGEIVIVNDCSLDDTGKKAEQMAGKYKFVRVLHNRKNLGLTGAAWRGFNAASNEVIVFLPSDLESDPEEDIPKLLEPLERGYDMSIGWRYNKRQGLVKGIISQVFNIISRMLFKAHFHDLGWVKAFKKEIIYNVDSLRADWHRFFAILAANEGYKIKEVKTTFYPRKHGKSRYGRFGLNRLSGGFFDLIVIKFNMSFSKKPMRVFGMIGAIFMFIGFLIGVYLLHLNFFIGTVVDRLPLVLLTVLFIIMGVQLFAIGFIAEFMASLREDLKRKR